MKSHLTSSSNRAFQAGCRDWIELVTGFLCGGEYVHSLYYVQSILWEACGGNYHFCLANIPIFSRNVMWSYFSKTLKMGVAVGHALAREMGAPVVWVTKSSKQFITSFSPQPQWPGMFLTVTIPSAWVLERGGRGEKRSANLEEHVAWASINYVVLSHWDFGMIYPLWYKHNSIFSGQAHSQVYAVLLHLITETHAKGFPITYQAMQLTIGEVAKSKQRSTRVTKLCIIQDCVILPISMCQNFTDFKQTA